MTDGMFDSGRRPSVAELNAILARAEIQEAQFAAARERDRYRYRSIAPVTNGSAYRKAVSVRIPVDLIAQGERIIDWIWRWSVVPLLGHIVADRLADQLDCLTDALDTNPNHDTTNSN